MRRVYDSRGRETVEATITTHSGHVGRAGAPSGASTGVHEVNAFPPGGVAEALATFRSTATEKLIGLDVTDQRALDRRLHEIDGTSNFSRIGGNTATAVSVAAAIAHAAAEGRPLWEVLRPGRERPGPPAIVGNCLNGGRHAIGGPDIQEFLAYAEGSPERAIPAALAVHRVVGETLHRRYPKHVLGRGDEGGWVAPVTNLTALEILTEACDTIRTETGAQVHPGLDLAASEFFRGGRYRYAENTVDTTGQLDYVTGLIDRFDLRYLEDPFQQEDFGAFAELTRAKGGRTLVVGDDLYATDAGRLRLGIERKSSNAILVKVNQVGTLSDTFETLDLAKASKIQTIISHRSGDLPEGWLAHLAYGRRAAGLKCGLLGGERVAKLNELLRVAAATGD